MIFRDVIILTDGKAGHENQSKAFARALGADNVQLVKVEFKSALHKAFSYLLDHLRVRTLRLFKPVVQVWSGEPSVIIGTGSGTFYAAKSLAQRLHIPCAVVLYPRGYSLKGFTCIMAPAFDRPARASNVITIPVNLVAADADFYSAGVAAFRERYQPKKSEAVAVIIGGPNKCSTMSAAWMKQELTKIFAATPNAEHWVTTSRRTPADVEAVVDSFPFDYKLLYSQDHFNPIPAFVSLAQTLYVTAESTGMLSEACTFGNAVVQVMDNLNPGPHKFRRFIEDLREAKFVDFSNKVNLTAAFARAKDLLTERTHHDKAN